jgi:hypothetical protein
MKQTIKKPTLQLNPPGEALDPEQEEARKAFLTEPEARKKAATAAEVKKEKPTFPWEAPGVNERIIKQLQVRLPEPDYLLLKYVVDNSKLRSIHAFMVQAIMQAAKKDFKKITESE